MVLRPGQVEQVLETYFMNLDNTYNKLQTLAECVAHAPWPITYLRHTSLTLHRWTTIVPCAYV